jgi:thiol:disulfide interchange protein DsbC
MKTISRCMLLASLLLAVGATAVAQDASKADVLPKDAAAVKKLLEAKFPGAPISNVSKSPYFGLYEAQLDDRMLYTDAKATYVIVGSVYDTATRTNLTEARMRKLNADCPFCKRLETEMQGLDDVTIYTFLFPIDSLHPDSAHKSAQIWCAPDRAQAWDDWFASGKLPDNNGDCATPIADVAQLGQKYRISATPTLVFADGSTVPGALPLERLQAEMKTAEAEAKKMASAPAKP